MMNALGRERYWRFGIMGVLAICALALIAPVLTASISDTIADPELLRVLMLRHTVVQRGVIVPLGIGD